MHVPYLPYFLGGYVNSVTGVKVWSEVTLDEDLPQMLYAITY